MINVINFWTTEGATSLRNILPKAGEIKNIKNMMKKKRQGKHCDIYFVFLHFAICSAKCAHASVTLVLDLTLAPITELQLTNNYSARHWQHVVLLVMIIGGIYLELVENKISSEYDITLAPNVSLNALFGLVHVRIYKFFWPQISAHARFLFCFVWRLRPLSVFISQNKASTNIW